MTSTETTAKTSISLEEDVDFKVALITGGTKGIGFAIAKALAESGHHLVLGYSSDHEAAEQAKKTIQDDYGKTVVCVNADTRDDETVGKYFEAVKEHFQNHLTVLVHHAGRYYGNFLPGEQLDIAHWLTFSEMYYKMYTRCFGHLIQKALQSDCIGLKHIMATSSPGCNLIDHPRVGYELVGIGKSAMQYLVRVNAKKLGPKGITVNCVIPGIIPTDEWRKAVQIVHKKENLEDVTESSGLQFRFCE